MFFPIKAKHIQRTVGTAVLTAALILCPSVNVPAASEQPTDTKAGLEELSQGVPGTADDSSASEPAADSGSIIDQMEELPANSPEIPEETAAEAAGRAMGFQEYSFKDVSETAYLLYFDNIVTAPDPEADTLVTLERFSEVHVTGVNELDYWRVEWEGQTGYISSEILTFDSEEIEAIQAEEQAAYEAMMKQHEQEILAAHAEVDLAGEGSRSVSEGVAEQARWIGVRTQTRNPNWNGPVLSRSAGSVMGPSGKETYYNLNMSGVVSIMRGMGNYDEYWVRDDGCKMLGPYIMCAANLSVHPRGSLVESSLGTCIVCDTGGFASHNAHQLDIAVTW